MKSLDNSKANKIARERAIKNFWGKGENGKGLSFFTPVQSDGKFVVNVSLFASEANVSRMYVQLSYLP